MAEELIPASYREAIKVMTARLVEPEARARMAQQVREANAAKSAHQVRLDYLSQGSSLMATIYSLAGRTVDDSQLDHWLQAQLDRLAPPVPQVPVWPKSVKLANKSSRYITRRERARLSNSRLVPVAKPEAPDAA
jgi:hypothetical protein